LLGNLSSGTPPGRNRPDFVSHTELAQKPLDQTHMVLSFAAPGYRNPEIYRLQVLSSLLGGGMSSRLFQEVREKRGLCYAIGSYTASYREAGMFAVYAGTSPKNANTVRNLSQAELSKVAKEGLGEEELQRAKNQIRGAVLLGLDSMSGRMTRLGKSLLYYDRVISPFEVVEKVERVTPEEIRRVAEAVFGGDFAYAAVGPVARSSNGARRAKKGSVGENG
jgi:predicted Zn-dependent peptidase